MGKKILYFSDLEGTILREQDGEFDDMEFYKLVDELTKLGELTDSKVEMRLISPIGFKRMNKIVNRMEKIIARHSNLSQKRQVVELEEAAASSYDISNDIYAYRTMSKTLTELPKVIHGDSHPARTAKRKYTSLVYESERYPEDITLAIYAGNGSNDIDAMRYIKAKKNGILICPRNSKTQIREMSHFASDLTDIKGVIDCVKKINEKILAKREISSNNSKDENKIEEKKELF